MKKYLLLLVAFFISTVAFAQLEVKSGSFKEIPGFINQNPEIIDDDNNVLYAVIKVRTENFNDKQRHQLLFQGNAATFIELEYKQDEIWVYLSSTPATYLKISHPDLGSTEFELPMDLKPRQGYEMVLVSKADNNVESGSLTIITKPENGATIVLNGKPIGQTTPFTNDVLPAGKYRISVSKERYLSATKTVYVKGGEHQTIEIELPPICAKVNINTQPTGATVYIDGKEYGVTPIENLDIIIGTHNLKIAQEGWVSMYKQFALEEEGTIRISERLAKCPDGAIDGVYNLSSYKSRYFFAKGNLQYQASTKTWRFAENQWDIIGQSNSNISPQYDGWIDLFGWGTGNNPTKTSKKGEEYKEFVDWGKNITSDGRVTKWCTMSSIGWYKLFAERETPSGMKFAKANVNGVNGLIFFPDTWITDNYALQGANDSGANYASNKISLSDWKTYFEANGAVFIPAAGRRIETNVYDSGGVGRYWGANAAGYDKSKSGSFWLTGNDLKSSAYENRGFGFSVRCVYPAEDILATGTYDAPIAKCKVPGHISIKTEPAGATVYIDGQVCGVTPLEINSWDIGSHELRISKLWWKTITKQFSFENGSNIVFNETMEEGLEGVINSAFSVSPTAKVRFSQGNLQYGVDTKTWSFAEHQWECVGDSISNMSANVGGWRDLFGWGTGKNPLNRSKDNNEYATFNDWGNNAISNGGNSSGVWRTLTKDEWDYLLNKRQTESGMRFVKAKVNDVVGMILLPDSWDKKTYKLKKVNKGKAECEDNIISKSDWEAVFEANGAVFLPAGGMFDTHYHGFMDPTGGYYWAAPNVPGDNNQSSIICFDGLTHDVMKKCGYSVRLVCPVK